jgi:hypothetical protein
MNDAVEGVGISLEDGTEHLRVRVAELRAVLLNLIQTRHELIVGTDQYSTKCRVIGYEWAVSPDAAIDAAVRAVKGETP